MSGVPAREMTLEEWVDRLPEGHSARKEFIELREARVRRKRFPIQKGPSIPWVMIEPHERQCKENHDQSLEKLASRGGLSPAEALCVLDDQKWRDSKWGNYMGDPEKDKAAHDELDRRRFKFEEYGPDYVDKLQQDIDERNVEIVKLKSDIQIMVNKAADKNLDGYRELGTKCAGLATQLDELRAQFRVLQGRISPSEICTCPEFCTWHARKNFETQAATIENLIKKKKAAHPVQEIAETLSILVHKQILINEGTPEEEAFYEAAQQAGAEWELWYSEAVTFAARFGITLEGDDEQS